MSQHQENWIVWMPFSWVDKPPFLLLYRMNPYFKNTICSVRRCGLYLQEMWSFLKLSQSTSRSFGRVPWSYKPLKSLASGKKLQYSLSSSQSTIKALCDFLGEVLVKSAIVKRQMRLEKSKICAYNNNFKMVFTQVAMLEKEKARLVMGQKTASDEVASLSLCVRQLQVDTLFSCPTCMWTQAHLFLN